MKISKIITNFAGAAAAVTMGLGYYMTSRPHGKIDPLVDPNSQTVRNSVSSGKSWRDQARAESHLPREAIASVLLPRHFSLSLSLSLSLARLFPLSHSFYSCCCCCCVCRLATEKHASCRRKRERERERERGDDDKERERACAARRAFRGTKSAEEMRESQQKAHVVAIKQ